MDNFLFALASSFVVVIPSYNNKDWYDLNLDSVAGQKFDNFRVIYIDDASTDGTGDLVAEYISERGLERRVALVRNEKRIGALENIYRAVWSCDPKEIVVLVDGDDWLAGEEVLETIHQAYSEGDVWMTYGQFIESPTGQIGGAARIPDEVVRLNGYRDFDWVSTHLRTFYAGLFQKIDQEDLRVEGEFYPVAWDLSFMFPMLEMAGGHSRFIPEVLYVYNAATPLSDRKLYLDLQIRFDRLIREKRRYFPVAAPF